MTRSNWRTPAVILACGGIVLTVSLGVRHNFGLYGLMWMLTIGSGIVAALLNLPIDDRQIARPAMKPA